MQGQGDRDTKKGQGKSGKQNWFRWTSRKWNEDAPSALTHMSTGVVYASPGVVKIPPCVLYTRTWLSAHRLRDRYHNGIHRNVTKGFGGYGRTDGYECSLVFRYLGIEVYALHAHQLEVFIHKGSTQLVGGQLDAEEEGGSRLGLEHVFLSSAVERRNEGEKGERVRLKRF